MKLAKFATMSAVVALSASLPTAPAHAQSEPLIGQAMLVGFNFCPRGWTTASGQLLAISQYSALFSLYGTIYGGDGRTTFALPDLRGRVPISQGQGPGLSPYSIGQRAGTETTTLTTSNMPAHNHNPRIQVSRVNANSLNPIQSYFARAASNTYETGTNLQGDTMHAGTILSDTVGGNQPFNNMQPYLTMQWCVALEGVYPSRN